MTNDRIHGESQNVEFKKAWSDEYLKWICGFANAQGGCLYIGLDDNGEAEACKISGTPLPQYTLLGDDLSVRFFAKRAKVSSGNVCAGLNGEVTRTIFDLLRINANGAVK